MDDSVDEMMRAWASHELDVDLSPLEVVGRLLLCSRRLEDDLVETLAPLGLSFADFDVLNTLRRRLDPTGTKPGELARSSLITSGAMSARLDRLENAGLIIRTPDPSDRRGVLVYLTPGGSLLADQALRAVLTCDEAFLHPLNRAQRASAATLLKRLLISSEQRRLGRDSG